MSSLKRIENLIKIKLTEDTDFVYDMNKEKSHLSALALKDTQPLYHSSDITFSLRDDIPKPSFSMHEALKNAHHKKVPYFLSIKPF